MTETAARLLRLLSLLQTRREWTGPDLAERLGVTVRTVRRDIERLRELEYPVHASLGSIGGYRLEAGTALPPLLLDDDEAVAITLGLRNAALGAVEGIDESSARALVKLQQVLPARLRRRVEAVQYATVSLGGPAAGPFVDPEILVVLAAACRDSERIRFRYHDKGDTETRRLAEPHNLVSAGRRWYLVAWDLDRADWRTFRVDRVESPQRTGIRSTPRELPTGDAAAFVTQSLAAAASRPVRRVVFRVHAPASEVIESFRVRPEEIEPVDDTSCLVRTSADSLEWTAVRIAHLGLEFEVVEPQEMADMLGDLGRRLLRAAGQRQ
ncbi:helix-turn-helix transcriptional regulator [Nocardia sp. CA-107356]|uniref:helix-turn-helix transcriptional regulator n=1 Tax=Nocardia sp. CA-107356 TaxID=3239972 RepID=UPI003D946760